MAIWYRTGTISITNGSAAMTGDGTLWLANAAPGMMVLGTGIVIGEVLTVNSNTSITLASNHTGATISGGEYSIANMSSVRDGLISAVNDSIKKFNTVEQFTPVFAQGYGAAVDGVTDDRAALLSAVSEGVTHLHINGPMRISSRTGLEALTYTFTSGGSIIEDGTTFFAARSLDAEAEEGGVHIARTLFLEKNPVVADGEYTFLNTSEALRSRWVSQWGYNELTEDGKMVGQGRPGIDAIPDGQTRLARTGAHALFIQASSTGEGDHRTFGTTFAVTPHSRTDLITHWAGQAHGGLFGGQVTAIGDEVGLYGLGDIVLTDGGNDSVSMWGLSLFLDHSGGDTSGYLVPRNGIWLGNRGTQSNDAMIVGQGKWDVGFDTTLATLDSNAAVAMKEGQRVYFDATDPGLTTGKFSTQDVGDVWIGKNAGGFLELGYGDTSILQATSSRILLRPGVASNDTLRIFGEDGNRHVAIGQNGNIAVFSAATFGSENTSILLQTATAGVEAAQVLISSSGSINLLSASASLLFDSTKVLGPRITGWGTPTGSADRTAFDSTTVTTMELAQRVQALILDLRNHGMIGD